MQHSSQSKQPGNQGIHDPMASRFTSRAAGAAAALALHALAGTALLTYEPARAALLSAAPIMVEMLSAPPVEAPKLEPRIQPPKPKAVAKRPAHQPAPVVSAPAETISPAVAVPAPSPTPEPLAAAAPLPMTQPVFNADYLDNPAPVYPAMSQRVREQGRVILRVLVNPSGAADQVEVRASSGFARLDDSARETVLRWKFVPAKRGAEPVPAWVLIPISFRLDG